MTQETIREAARVKFDHAASMVDCFLIAYALEFEAAILTADSGILRYAPKRAKTTNVGKRFKTITWR
jgi:hypothetical protein